MKESQSKRLIYVSHDGDAAPYVIVPRAQVEQVLKLFRKHGVEHSLNEREGKDYRKGKGLFGKYKGLWYWGPQLAGSGSEGVVVSDYEVKREA